MTKEKIVCDVLVSAGEWLEMTDNPNEMIVWILAGKIEKLHTYIEYLEKRISYDSTATNIRVN